MKIKKNDMIQIKINDKWALGLPDKRNLVLLLTSEPKDKDSKYDYIQSIEGSYGLNFSALVSSLINMEIVSARCDTIEQLDCCIKEFIKNINFDGIIRDLHRKVTSLQAENNELKRQLERRD